MFSVRVGAPTASPSALPASPEPAPDIPLFDDREIDSLIENATSVLTPADIDEQLIALGIEERPLSDPYAGPRLPLGPLPGRVLVTGGAGYFGGILARFLADRDIEVVSLDRLADPDPDPRIVEVVADLRHAEEIGAVLGDQGPFDEIGRAHV